MASENFDESFTTDEGLMLRPLPSLEISRQEPGGIANWHFKIMPGPQEFGMNQG